jgi:Zn-dependent peptidase ImmA (M78 family)
MQNYSNKSIETIANIFKEVNFKDVDNVFPVPIGEICDKICLNDISLNKDDNVDKCLFKIANYIGCSVLYHKNFIDLEIKQKQEVNDFALELILPESKFIDIFFETRKNFKRIANFLGVSASLAEKRAFYLGLIDSL